MEHAGVLWARWWLVLETPTLRAGVLAAGLVTLIFVLIHASPGRAGRGLRRLAQARPLALAGMILACGFAIWRAIDGMWVGDDAFISFRYADNLVSGHGLVFNPGERVEGYTNLLWTLVIAAAIGLGFPAPEAALVLNLTCLTLHLGLVVFLLLRLDPLKDRAAPWMLTPLMLAGSYTFVTFGTSGLETPLLGLLTSAGFGVFALRRGRGGLFAAGLLVSLATLAHPDHLLALVALGAVLGAEHLRGLWDAPGGDRLRALRAGIGDALLLAFPGLLLLGGQLLFRVAYYGEWLPNTYYAKMGGPYWSQGAAYLLAFLSGEGYWLWLMVLPLLVWIPGQSPALRRLTRTSLLFAALMVAYSLKIGGDFMYGRLFASSIAPLWIVLELNLRGYWRQVGERPPHARPALWRRAVLAVTLGMVLMFSLVQPPLLRPAKITAHLADEATYYKVTTFHPIVLKTGMYRRATTLGKALADIEPKPLLAMRCVGMMAYYTKAPIIDLFGLNDHRIARTPLGEKRGRPGHERNPTQAYLLERKPLLFERRQMEWPHRRHRDEMSIRIGHHVFYLTRWDGEFVAQLLKSGVRVRVTDFRTRLVDYLKTADTRSAATIRRDLAFFDDFYFAYHPADERIRQAIAEKIEERESAEQEARKLSRKP